MMTARPEASIRRRAELEAREELHLACPRCAWIVQPVDALHIDRMVRLVEHLAELHPFDLAYLSIAWGHVAREAST